MATGNVGKNVAYCPMVFDLSIIGIHLHKKVNQYTTLSNKGTLSQVHFILCGKTARIYRENVGACQELSRKRKTTKLFPQDCVMQTERGGFETISEGCRCRERHKSSGTGKVLLKYQRKQLEHGMAQDKETNWRNGDVHNMKRKRVVKKEVGKHPIESRRRWSTGG